jgi:imidazole glycerol-phosphate synthase subunit HisF
MLRHRLITVLTLNDGVLYRTKEFHPDYRYTLSFVDAWLIDEIVLLDVTRPGAGDRANFEAVVDDIARRCFVPLACGGYIRSIDDVRRLLRIGADKVILNTGAVERPELVSEASALFGAQCVVVSIDARRLGPTRYEVYTHCGTRPTGLEPAAWAARAQGLGAGEILITAIERDGSLEGYDNELNRLVADAVTVPVLICGGAGSWRHFADGLRLGGASAVCTTNIYHFTETSIKSAKRYLQAEGFPVRTS